MKDSKYEEALERARQGMPIDEVFPELKESEDERIRKEIIGYLNNRVATAEETELLYFKRWIAYLERQKKQTTKTDACGFPIRDKGESACSYLERCLAPDMRNIWYEACAEIKEKQKEQQPAEWSEEDGQMLTNIISGLEATKQLTYAHEELGKAQMQERIDWLKSLRPRHHWKPSKEQIGALNYAYCELFKRGDVGHNILGPFQSLIDTLRKL